MNNEAHREASQWIFKGGTGSHPRAVTLRACVESAREANRPMRMKIEIIDPTDKQLCRRYEEYRASLRSGSEKTTRRPPQDHLSQRLRDRSRDLLIPATF
jgi:hypothetical protein